MSPLSLLLIYLPMIFSLKEVTITDSDRIVQLEDVLRTLLGMQEKDRQENALQNSKIRALEETMARYEEENKKLMTENVDLKSRLKSMELSIWNMDIRMKQVEKENIEFQEAPKSQAEIMDYVQFRTLNNIEEKLENSREPENLISLKWDGSEELKLSEVNIESKSLSSFRKRLLSGIPSAPQPNGVAFSVYLTQHETHLTEHQTILFDGILTNIGGHYNRHSGVFTAPTHGVYVFTWNLYCNVNGRIFSEIAVNSHQIGSMFTSGEGATNIRTTTGLVVAEVNKGDIVLVRTHPTKGSSGGLYSDPAYKSTFSGWLLF